MPTEGQDPEYSTWAITFLALRFYQGPTNIENGRTDFRLRRGGFLLSWFSHRLVSDAGGKVNKSPSPPYHIYQPFRHISCEVWRSNTFWEPTRTIQARNQPGSPLDSTSVGNSFQNTTDAFGDQHRAPTDGHPAAVSSPRVSQLFNIFHPSDPICYRLEPLIAPLMSKLKPQALPYTKKGIFGNVAPQGLSNIGAKVGQSVSGLWSSFSSGVTTNLLNRSLGLSSEEVARMTAASAERRQGSEEASLEQLAADASDRGERTSQLKRELGDLSNPQRRTSLSGNEATLLDYDLETLFSSFEKGRLKSAQADPTLAGERDTSMRKTRLQEAKVRALNRNGRVDYGIQE
jgi:hypothetical protein